MDVTVADAFLSFFMLLASSNSGFIQSIYNTVVDHCFYYLYPTPDAEKSSEDPSIKCDILAKVQSTIYTLNNLVPTGANYLTNAVRSNYPFKVSRYAQLEHGVKFVLELVDKIPIIKNVLISFLIEKLLELDVNN